jgi:hypothetical protein
VVVEVVEVLQELLDERQLMVDLVVVAEDKVILKVLVVEQLIKVIMVEMLVDPVDLLVVAEVVEQELSVVVVQGHPLQEMVEQV